MSAARIRIVLEIDPTVAVIGGQIFTQGHPPRAFSGWLQLAEAITEMLPAGHDQTNANIHGVPIDPRADPTHPAPDQ